MSAGRRRPDGATTQLVERVEVQRPFWEHFELFRRRPFAFLLDSAGGPGETNAYSFMGADPIAVFEARRMRDDPERRAGGRTSRGGAAPAGPGGDPLAAPPPLPAQL